MREATVACSKCKAPIPSSLLDGAFHSCPNCLTSIRVLVFPAFAAERTVALAEPTVIEGESSCFYHPHKKAVLACESCGRFLCSLCDIELSGVHRCPRCLEAGKRKQELDALEMQHTRYDRIAFALTTVGLLFWPVTLITAPAALFLVVRFWHRRSKILPGSRLLFIMAGLFAIAEICGWGLFIYSMFSRR
jgi:hypothetical protein